MPSKKGAKAAEAQPEKKAEAPEEKPAEDSKDQAVEESETKDASKDGEGNAADKRARGRPKKADGEPATKKPKKVKESHVPSRASRRVANMKTGETLPEIEDKDPMPKPKKTTTKKKAEPSEPADDKQDEPNGAAEVAVQS
ncbi:predicted protein [Nematostella vectensis]|uniref:Uncharacterized protein n=1 Tax=Nematostella vectensis TaxID=45351 RepID=A7T099_NEMVE|nr:chromo domain-containing protein cec-1 [Nematostella vectensis]EDO30618.1 predicted protein [Nematostella vectensis]|eukprot:XP_001622718.1 predicted protein [Nematostella vectensis]